MLRPTDLVYQSQARLIKQLLEEEQLGVHLSKNVKKTLLAASIFHEKAVRCREEFLRAETVSLRNKIEDEEDKIRNADDKRAEIMTILTSVGALEEFIKLQARLLAKQHKLYEILGKFKDDVVKEKRCELNAPN